MTGQQGRQCLLEITLERLLKLLGGIGPAIAGSRHGRLLEIEAECGYCSGCVAIT
jgi:hypothetical protein